MQELDIIKENIEKNPVRCGYTGNIKEKLAERAV